MEKTCPYCSKQFKTYDRRQIFCSMTCGHKNRSKNKIMVKANCKYCGDEFVVQSSKGGRKLFCCLQCFHKWNTKDKVKLICENCGKEFYKPPYAAKGRRNCSKKCKYELLGKENSKRFTGVPVKKLSERRQLDVYRQIAFDKLPNVCYICSSSNQKFEVHHIDGNRDNNSINNLIILCGSCHKNIHKLASKHNLSLENSLKVKQIIGKSPVKAYLSKEWLESVRLSILEVVNHQPQHQP